MSENCLTAITDCKNISNISQVSSIVIDPFLERDNHFYFSVSEVGTIYTCPKGRNGDCKNVSVNRLVELAKAKMIHLFSFIK